MSIRPNTGWYRDVRTQNTRNYTGLIERDILFIELQEDFEAVRAILYNFLSLC